mmetsp:Transcript_42492/g.132169  ORF Transcript_42492/g.132169 Transcript_42492/m.132169 type:complete len:198 (+) Transcript_42492:64-657(+)
MVNASGSPGCPGAQSAAQPLRPTAGQLPPRAPAAFYLGASSTAAKPGCGRAPDARRAAQQQAERSLCFTTTGFVFLLLVFFEVIGLPSEPPVPIWVAVAPAAPAVPVGGPICDAVPICICDAAGWPAAVAVAVAVPGIMPCWPADAMAVWGYGTSMEGAVGMPAALVTMEGAICSEGKGLAWTVGAEPGMAAYARGS